MRRKYENIERSELRADGDGEAADRRRRSEETDHGYGHYKGDQGFCT